MNKNKKYTESELKVLEKMHNMQEKAIAVPAESYDCTYRNSVGKVVTSEPDDYYGYNED